MAWGLPSSKTSKSSGCKSVTTLSPLVTEKSICTRLVVIFTTSWESISGVFSCGGGGCFGDGLGCCAKVASSTEQIRQKERRIRAAITNPPKDFSVRQYCMLGRMATALRKKVSGYAG